MASYSRFDDKGYKNWLKTTMSLWLLRSRLSGFLENETETFHNSLRNKLKKSICKKRCIFKINRNKVPDICQDCELWRNEILENHGNKKGIIYWENCKPCLWSSEKWEVAKVYMPRGNKEHSTVDQFDISAVLNFMIFCKHFTKFAGQPVLREVTAVRNQMMHSADMKVLKEDMKKHLNKILALVKQLQNHVPELIDLEREINQLEEAELNIMVEGQVNNRETPVMNLLNKQKILDLEQQVMKEKIESLASRLEEGRELNNEEYQRMKEFLDENKDLLEQLRPNMEKLKAIQEKLEQHDQQLTALTGTVDELVKKTEEPVFSADVLRYKNHLLEIARKFNWPTPVFSEEHTPQGYIGIVEVRGKTFKSQNVHPKVKAAHQEASKIALEQLDMQSTEETSQTSSSSSSESSQFFASVKVPVKTEFEGPEASSEEASAVGAYRSLEEVLKLGDTGAGSSSDDARTRVHDFFSRAGCRPPEEYHSKTGGKFRSKLCINGDFTFQSQEGMSKKQLAEQAAAKEALVRLAGVLGWDLTGMNENCKGRLQESLVRQGHEPPTYKPVYKSCHPEPNHSGAESEINLASVSMTEATVSVGNTESQAKSSIDSNQTSSQKEKPTNGTPAPITSTEQLSGHNIPSVASYDNAPVQDIVLATPILKDDSMVSSASGTFFASVKVPVKAEFEGPEAGSEDAAVVEAYKSLEQALNLGDTGAGSSSDDATKRVHVFFRRSGSRLPETSSSPTADGKFRSKLCISGDLSFQNPGGMSKKQLAEQAAAKEALFRLAGVLGWDLTGINENYKGTLQELLVKQGHGPPSYQPVNKSCHTEPSHSGAESEMNLASVPMPEATLSVGNTECQATPWVDTNQFPPQVEKPMTETPSPMTSTVQPSGKSSSVTVHDTAAVQGIVLGTSIHNDESSVSSESSQFFASVKVPVKAEFEGPEAGSEETAAVEAYKSLEQALNLRDTGAGSCPDGARMRVHDFFSRAGCRPLEERSVTIADGKFRSKLCISGDLTFQNPLGMTKKQKAEQAAAKEALYRLAGVLRWDLAEVNENYKGRLQELVVKEGHGPPTYQPVLKPCHTEPIHSGAEKSGAGVSPMKIGEAVMAAKTSRQSPVDQTQLPPDLKKPKIEYPDFERILKMFGLRPTSVISENMDIDDKFQFTVEINLLDFTYSNQLGYNSKKDVIRNTYLILGQAIGISDPNTEESQSSMLVKQYFSQKLFSLPIEQVEEKDQKKFYCSLKVASCRISYEGRGETEEAAKREACNRAVSQLGPLFGYEHKSTCSSEEAAERLTLMLEEAGQGPPALRKTGQWYKATVQLQFKDFVLEIKGQNKKKSAQSELCTKILILLGEDDTETGKDVSVRNRVDDWFKQKQLPPPVFEETKESAPDQKEGFGMKATFSGQIICSHSDWQVSEEKAVGKLTEELKRRFQAC